MKFKLIVSNKGKNSDERLDYKSTLEKLNRQKSALKNLGFEFDEKNTPKADTVAERKKFDISCQITNFPKNTYNMISCESGRFIVMLTDEKDERPLVLFKFTGFDLKVKQIFGNVVAPSESTIEKTQNLVIEWEGKSYMVDRTASDVYDRPMAIKIVTLSGPIFLKIQNWEEKTPPIPREIVVSDESPVYYNAIELVD